LEGVNVHNTTNESENAVDDITFSLTNILRLSLSGYDFVVHFAEHQKNYSKGFLHQHPYIEMYCVLSGGAVIHIEDEIVHLDAEKILILAPDVNHLMEKSINNELSYFVLIFRLKPEKHRDNNLGNSTLATYERKVLDEFITQLNKNKYFYISASQEIIDLCHTINKEINDKSLEWETLLKFHYYQLFVYVVRSIMPKKRIEDVDDFSNIAVRAVEYLHEHYSEKITLESLGAYLYVSPRHANRTFKKMYGCTFYETLKQIRLVYAKNLLLTTDMQIELVAAKTGFCSAQVLSKAYKKQEGVTIRESRKLSKAIKK